MRRSLQIIFVFLTFILNASSYGQDQRIIDSVRTLLKNKNLSDKQRAYSLSKLGWHVSYYDLNEGLKYAEEGYNLAKKNNYLPEMADAANVTGTIYMDLGDYPTAIDYLQKAISYNEQYKNMNGAAVSASNLSIIYNRRKEYRKALNAGHKAISYLQNYPRSLLSAYLNVGGTYMDMKFNDSAMFFLNKALDVFAKIKPEPLLKSSILNSIAEVYMNKNDLVLAKQYINDAINLVPDSTQHYYLTEHYITLAKIQMQGNEFAAAIISANKALTWSKIVGVKDYEKNCYELLSQAYEKQNNTLKSFEFYKLYTQIKDTILNSENERQIHFMEGKLEMDKKEKEIELLNKDKILQDAKIQHDKNLINAFILAGIILVLALSFAIYAFANKRKANKKLHSLNNEIHKQKNQLLEKNTAITDSIQYASRIQTALLTSEDYIRKYLPDFFILNIPKDIVSGDFYWAYAQNNKMYFMCADCTGHGVPGAFMSLLGINFLNEIVIEKKITSPNLVLNELRTEIIHSLNKQGSEETKDGMDCAICEIDLNTLELQLATANNSVWVLRPPASPMLADANGVFKLMPGFKFTDVKPDKMPVGKSPKEETSFTLKKYSLKKGDCIYMFSDGFVDQFGGPKGKKMKYKILKETIFKNCHLPMAEQKLALKKCFTSWKADLEQVDDVLVVGIKV